GGGRGTAIRQREQGTKTPARFQRLCSDLELSRPGRSMKNGPDQTTRSAAFTTASARNAGQLKEASHAALHCPQRPDKQLVPTQQPARTRAASRLLDHPRPARRHVVAC